jgi:TctA family transporter
MIEALAAAAGLFAGIALALVPGLHIALVFVFIVMLFPGAATACFVATAAGASIYAKRLALVYNPQAGSLDVLSPEPAIRMTRDGNGPQALRLSLAGADTAATYVLAVATLILLATVAGLNVVDLATKALRPVTTLVIIVWALTVVVSSSKPFKTCLGLGLTAAVGFLCLHHPALTGDAHQLAPLLTGLFTVPIILGTLKSGGIPPQVRFHETTFEQDPDLARLGALTGLATGFLAGLGAGSLCSLWASRCETDEDYLLLSAAAETANDLFALVLVLVAGITRSGEAAALARLVPNQSSTTAVAALLLLTLVGAVVARLLVLKLEAPYIKFVRQLHRWIIPVFILGLAFAQVVSTQSPLVALAITVAAACTALLCRRHELPQQVAFAALALPLLVQQLGLVGPITATLF